ncbi:GerMN domain-containing protein [Clostridium sp.]|jgi:spore germination protein GerM|uniref:GerMN domain-containing protein n=1 Tax=Clostridium sp. TaxID=1506 RepID=UPI0039F5BB3C
MKKAFKILGILIFPVFIFTSCSSLRLSHNPPAPQSLKLYYPQPMNNDVRIVSTEAKAYLKTDGEVKDVFENYFKTPVKSNLSTLISKDTKINKLYLNTNENKVYVDFSKEFLDDMNAGGSKELLILKSITNTLGTYYNCDKVYITIDGEPYSSGHVSLDKGESFSVDYDDIEEIT